MGSQKHRASKPPSGKSRGSAIARADSTPSEAKRNPQSIRKETRRSREDVATRRETVRSCVGGDPNDCLRLQLPNPVGDCGSGSPPGERGRSQKRRHSAERDRVRFANDDPTNANQESRRFGKVGSHYSKEHSKKPVQKKAVAHNQRTETTVHGSSNGTPGKRGKNRRSI
jgi:hypothetical protein